MKNEPNRLVSKTLPVSQKHSWLRGLFLTASVVVLSGLAVLYGPQVVDAIKASQFRPSSQLSSVVSRVQLKLRGVQILYATDPQIEDQQQFNQSCHSTERTAAILGCYYKDRIYLYDIKNTDLDGTLEVTAAHEMLHAAYERLNVFERAHVDLMVNAEYAKIKDLPTIKQVMQYYSEAEPGDEVNELHSIIGTTIANLSPDLEQYYSQYFSNRAAVVAMNAHYNQVFEQLNSQAEALQQKIETEEVTLKTDMASYNNDLQQLNLDIDNFNKSAKADGFSSQHAFQTARAVLSSRIDTMNMRRDALDARVDEYNSDVDSLNNIAIHVNELNQSMNGVNAPGGV